MKSNRVVYGDTLVELAAERPELVVLDADVAKSTGTSQFGEAYPDRFVNVGIAEQNMVGMAAGMATCGKLPFIATFGVFTSMRAVEQLRNAVCYPNLNVKVAATHSGLETGEDGATHQSLEDISIIRSIPNIRLLVPSTPVATRSLTRLAADTAGPFYLRFGKADAPEFYKEGETFPLGKSKQLTEGDDATILAIGNTLEVALDAAKALEAEGIKVRVLDMYSLKPYDEQAILKAARETKGLVTIEDHSIIGGLGGIVSEAIAGKVCVPLIKLGVKDVFGRSGTKSELFELFGLTAGKVADVVRSFQE